MATIKKLAKGTLVKEATNLELPALLSKKADIDLTNVPNNDFINKAIEADLTKAIGTATHKLSSYTSLSDAISQIGSDESVLLIDRSETITSDITIPKNIAIQGKRGNVLTISDGVKLTINSEIQCGLYQLFDIPGTGTISGRLRNHYTWAEWFGVHPDNADNSTQFKNAYLFTRGLKCKGMKIGAGKFLFTNNVEIDTGGTEIDIIGSGQISSPVAVNYPTETAWVGTILDFRNAGTLTSDAISFSDDTLQDTHITIKDLTIVSNNNVDSYALNIHYAPQSAELKNLMILQTGDGGGLHISDVWTGFKIENVWIRNTNGLRSNIDNKGFWLEGHRNSGGNIYIYNLNVSGFRVGRQIGWDPAGSISKAERTIFMVGSQTQDAEIGLFLGNGATQIVIVTDWLEKITKKGVVVTGFARDIKFDTCRYSAQQIEAGGCLIQLGQSDSEGVTTSLYKRAKVIFENCYFHSLPSNTCGVKIYRVGQDAPIYFNNTNISLDGTIPDPETVYGIVFADNEGGPNRSIVINQMDWGDGSNNRIQSSNRIVKTNADETDPYTDATDRLKLYISDSYTDWAYFDKVELRTTRVSNYVLTSGQQHVFDWTTFSTAGFINENTANYITVTNLNNANRAIYFPKLATSKGKFYIIERTDNDTDHYLNLRHEINTDGGSVFYRIHTKRKVLVWNQNGEWKVKSLDDNEIGIGVYRTSEYKNFSDAINKIGSEVCTLVVDYSENLTSNVTVPKNITLMWKDGAILDGSYNLTIEGDIIASRKQIFGSSINVSFVGGTVYVYPEWWGADPSGNGGSAYAVESAINACNITLVPPNSIYALDRTVEVVKTRRQIIAYGSKFKPTSSFINNDPLFYFHSDFTNNTIHTYLWWEGGKLELSNANGIKVAGMHEVYIRDVYIQDNSPAQVIGLEVQNCFNVYIEDSGFHSANSTESTPNTSLQSIAIKVIGDPNLDGQFDQITNIGIYNSLIHGWYYGFYAENNNSSSYSTNFKFVNTAINNTTMDSIHIYGSVHDINVDACHFENTDGTVLYVDSSFGSRYSSVTFRGCSVWNCKTVFDFKGSGYAIIEQGRFHGSAQSPLYKLFNVNAYDVQLRGYNSIWTTTYNPNPTDNTGGTIQNDTRAVVSRTSNKTLNALDENKTFTNTGATSDINFYLPNTSDVNPGYTVRFVVTEAYVVTVNPYGTDTIYPSPGTQGTAISANTVGSFVTLMCVANGKWIALESNGFA